jgi:hypothetical protein
MKLRIMFLTACGLAPLLLAQQAAMPVGGVKANPAGEIPVTGPSIVSSAMCDEAGNVYARPFDEMDGLQSLLAPVVKIATAGNPVGSFPISDAVPGGARSRTFSVHDGRVYAMVGSSQGGLYVVQFEPDGSPKAPMKVELEHPVDVFHFAVFKSGQYLLVGLTGQNLRTPYTAVFSADGRLVKKIYEPEDEEARLKADGGDARYAPCCTDSGNAFVMEKSDVTAGSDGNVYLLHGSSPPLIYVISPAGEVVRKLRIELHNSALTANSIKFHAGRLAVGFNWLGDAPKNMVKVVDAKGNSIADYEIEEHAGDSDPILACYSSEGFTLVPRRANAKLRVLKAKLP